MPSVADPGRPGRMAIVRAGRETSGGPGLKHAGQQSANSDHGERKVGNDVAKIGDKKLRRSANM
jgi:hypothetical protein